MTELETNYHFIKKNFFNLHLGSAQDQLYPNPQGWVPGICASETLSRRWECATRFENCCVSLLWPDALTCDNLLPSISATGQPPPPGWCPSSWNSLRWSLLTRRHSVLHIQLRAYFLWEDSHDFPQGWNEWFLQLHRGIIYIPHNLPIISGDDFQGMYSDAQPWPQRSLRTSPPSPANTPSWPIPAYIPNPRQPRSCFLSL